jgi:hypothetical protein
MGYDIRAEREAKRAADRQARIDRMNKSAIANLIDKVKEWYSEQKECAGSSLFQCEDCGKEISKKATACPGCGSPVNKKLEVRLSGILGAAFFVALIVYSFNFSIFTRKSPSLTLTLPSINQQIVTFTKYQKIENGMSYHQVVEIIGTQGQESSRNHMDGVPGVVNAIETVMYQWINPNGSNMNAIFQNDKLMQKAQFGLE